MMCFSTIWLKMSQFIRSVSDHGLCGIKLKLSPVGVHLSVVLLGSVVAMATRSKNLSKKEENYRKSAYLSLLRHLFFV